MKRFYHSFLYALNGLIHLLKDRAKFPNHRGMYGGHAYRRIRA